MKYSFCVTNKNRLEALSQALPVNIQHALDDDPEFEFVLIDFNSSDSSVDWVLENCGEALKRGHLKFFRTETLDKFHMSTCKNTAHLYAMGDIVTNLDGDNFIGRNGVSHVQKQFIEHGKSIIFHQWSGQYRDGSCGRISLSKELFDSVGGYDESFAPLGYNDTDLIKRLQAMHDVEVIPEPVSKIQRVRNKISKRGGRYTRHNSAIVNTKAETMADHGQSIEKYNRWNRSNVAISDANIENETYVVNDGKYGVRENVFMFNPDTDKFELVDAEDFRVA